MTPLGQCHQRAAFLGLEFDLLDEAEATQATIALAAGVPFAYVVTPNVDHLVRLHRQANDLRLWSAYRQAALCLCDSRILGVLSRSSGQGLTVVPGSDLTARLLASANGPTSAVIVGGDESLLQNMRLRYPHVDWLQHIAPHGILENLAAQKDIVDFVEKSSAELTFFAIGSPQSELICAALAKRKKAIGVGLCIGASLEFLTGAKTRAPRWMQKAGLEWLFRLVSEPARLWRRYLMEGPTIFLIWWRWRLRSAR
jgi:exopolysaccharide biosynthesis WecB/TagA/CpsF family protein